MQRRHAGDCCYDLPEGESIVLVTDMDGCDVYQAAMIVDGQPVPMGPHRQCEAEVEWDFQSGGRHAALEAKPGAETAPEPGTEAWATLTLEQQVDQLARRARIRDVEDYIKLPLRLKAMGLAELARHAGDKVAHRTLMDVALSA